MTPSLPNSVYFFYVSRRFCDNLFYFMCNYEKKIAIVLFYANTQNVQYAVFSMGILWTSAKNFPRLNTPYKEKIQCRLWY